ncbi:MAG: carboxypeptidase regulatory-like domain-containing protein, partial [Polaromonas sp.]|nr:carboxypeptidase regulatory-like domain-containing protein [Gemmatimonadaceae bacterium]
MRPFLQRLIAVAALIVAMSLPALAQNTITLEGSVKSEGAPVSGAQVAVVDTATQETGRATTRPTGDFPGVGLFA